MPTLAEPPEGPKGPSDAAPVAVGATATLLWPCSRLVAITLCRCSSLCCIVVFAHGHSLSRWTYDQLMGDSHDVIDSWVRTRGPLHFAIPRPLARSALIGAFCIDCLLGPATATPCGLENARATYGSASIQSAPSEYQSGLVGPPLYVAPTSGLYVGLAHLVNDARSYCSPVEAVFVCHGNDGVYAEDSGPRLGYNLRRTRSGKDQAYALASALPTYAPVSVTKAPASWFGRTRRIGEAANPGPCPTLAERIDASLASKDIGWLVSAVSKARNALAVSLHGSPADYTTICPTYEEGAAARDKVAQRKRQRIQEELRDRSDKPGVVYQALLDHYADDVANEGRGPVPAPWDYHAHSAMVRHKRGGKRTRGCRAGARVRRGRGRHHRSTDSRDHVNVFFLKHHTLE